MDTLSIPEPDLTLSSIQPTSIHKIFLLYRLQKYFVIFAALQSRFYFKAMRWPAENATSDSCCSDGKIRLDAIKDPPEPLHLLLTGMHEQSSHFKKHLREFNCAFQMASSTAEITEAPPGISSVVMSGRLYIRLGPLFFQSGHQPTFAQMFLFHSN